jgi:hypothetical protein
MARALRPAMSAIEWYQFKAEESRAIAEELSNPDCKMKMLRNAAMWDMLSKGPYLAPRRHQSRDVEVTDKLGRIVHGKPANPIP